MSIEASPAVPLRVTEPEGRNSKVSPMTLPRVVFWKKDLRQMLGVSIRTLDRMISSGEIPAPDRPLRGRPAWLAQTINTWVADGCPPYRTQGIRTVSGGQHPANPTVGN